MYVILFFRYRSFKYHKNLTITSQTNLYSHDVFFPSDLFHPETGMKLKPMDIATINPSICLVQPITLGNHQPLKSRYMMKTSV